MRRPPSLVSLLVLVGCTTTETAKDLPPTVTITSPADPAPVLTGASLALTGTVRDTEDPSGALTGRWFVADLEVCPGAPLADDGTTTCTVTAPAGPSFDIRLEGTDSAGLAGTTSITLPVIDVQDTDNRPPTCTITSPTSGGMSTAGSPVELAAEVADPDGAVEDLVVQWTSDRDGLVGAATADSDGTAAASTTALSDGAHVISVQVTDPAGGTCTDAVDWTVDTPPTVEILAPEDGAIFELGGAVEFTVAVEDAEDPPEDLTVSWESELDGLVYEANAAFDGELRFTTTGLTAGTHTLTVTVTDPEGLRATALETVVIDTPPDAPVVSLSPSAPTTRDALVVNLDTPAVDPDGDPVRYLYAWSVDGVVSGASTSDTLPASATTAGETWTVAVTATDDWLASPVGEASATIVSSEPAVTTVTVSPPAARVGDTLTCSATAVDADGSTLPVTYTWSTGGTGATLTLDDVGAPGTLVTCTATASTGDGAIATGEASALVRKTPPSVDSIELSAPVVHPAAPIVCVATASDVDGGAPTLTYAWSTGESGAAITGPADAAPGSSLTCTATATDADGGSASASASALVYTPPDVVGVGIGPDPLRTDDTAVATATSVDPDGEAVTLTYTWYVDGAEVQAGADATLAGTVYFDRDDVVTVVVTADDGTSTSTGESAPVLVTNTAPEAPAVAIDPPSPDAGDSLTCAVTTVSVDADGDTATYRFAWTVDGVAFTGAADDDTTSVVDGAEVAAEDQWTCTATPNDGLEDGEPGSASATVAALCTAAVFTGDGDYAAVPDAPDLDVGKGDFTIEGWFQLATAGDWGYLYMKRDSSADSYVYLAVGNDAVDGWLVTPSDWLQYEVATPVSLDEWHHVAFVREDDDVRLYLDGLDLAAVLVRVRGSTSPGDVDVRNNGAVEIARNAAAPTDAGYGFDANLADLRLTRSAVYTGDFTPAWPLDVETDTTLLLHMDEGGGSTFDDSSGLGHDGTAYGTGWTTVAACPS